MVTSKEMSTSSAAQIKPFFIKGDLSLSIHHQNYEFLNQNISTSMITGLPWGSLDPDIFFGAEAELTIQLHTSESPRFQAKAVIFSEQTLRGSAMGLRLFFDPEEKARLETEIQNHGFVPTEFLRKYPRIPATPLIQTFPLRALVIPPAKAVPPGTVAMTFDIQNLNPNGLLLSSESPLARKIEPNMRLNLVIESRGWFPSPIHAQGLVCRVSNERSAISKNPIRYLGIKFSKIDDANRAILMNLLRGILENLKKA